MSLLLAFVAGMLTACAMIAVGFALAARRVKVPPPPVAPYKVYDRSDAAVAAMERTRKSGTPARPPGGNNVLFDMQAPTP